jgi:hypothetical protein
MYVIQHISKEENKTISGTREKSAVADSAKPKQEDNSSADPPTFPAAPTLADANFFLCANISVDANIFHAPSF